MTIHITFFHDVSDEQLDVWFCDHRLYGEVDGEELSSGELISVINSLNEADTVRLIKECGGPKRFRHAYRKLHYENPVKTLDRDLKGNNSSLEEYLEISYRAGLNPLPALRARGIVVRFGGQNAACPHFTNEDVIVTLDEGYVTVVYNPWNADTAARIVNKGLKFRLEQAADIKRNRETRLKNRVIRKNIVKYSSED
ncbi:MAG: hypothetical protein M0R31_06140 [Candidatus Riflebacteria bacterium]|nr:hypothetical protein [Candidatus Riflebacteria bacterium]